MMTTARAYEKFRSNPYQDTLDHLPRFRSWARGHVLEIGVHEGASTSAFLLGLEESGGHLWSIDVNPACGRIFAEGHPQWTFLYGDSHDQRVVTLTQGAAPFSLLFVDGDHSYEGCLADLRNYSPMVEPGGMVLVHDVRFEKSFPGVRRAFDEFVIETGWGWMVYEESCGLGVLVCRKFQ